MSGSCTVPLLWGRCNISTPVHNMILSYLPENYLYFFPSQFYFIFDLISRDFLFMCFSDSIFKWKENYDFISNFIYFSRFGVIKKLLFPKTFPSKICFHTICFQTTATATVTTPRPWWPRWIYTRTGSSRRCRRRTSPLLARCRRGYDRCRLAGLTLWKYG